MSDETPSTEQALVRREYGDDGLRADGGTEHWREDDDCVGCGADDVPLRNIKMRDGSRKMTCRACFEDALEDGRVHPSDPRVEEVDRR